MSRNLCACRAVRNLGDPLGACLRDPPRGIKTRAIGIEQQGRHHARIEWRLTKPAFVACDDLRQIQVLARQSDGKSCV